MTSQTSFKPYFEAERSVVQLRSDVVFNLDSLLDCFLSFMHEGSCRAVVRYSGDPNESLRAAIYAPSEKDADLVPRDLTIVDIALMLDEGRFMRFANVTMADQVYWISDRRPGHARSYLISTEQSTEAVGHLLPETAYYYQEEAADQPLSYEELVALLDGDAVVIDKPLDNPQPVSLYGPVVVVENMTMLTRVANSH